MKFSISQSTMLDPTLISIITSKQLRSLPLNEHIQIPLSNSGLNQIKIKNKIKKGGDSHVNRLSK